jgi:signal transduction histidine kinase
VRQVLVNLVGNASKFTEHGEIVVEVASQPVDQSHEPGDSRQTLLHFSGRDTGIGIPPDRQRAILEPFVQADGSMTRKCGGTGLGLTISKQLVELMGGQLRIESQVGHGSAFHFTASTGDALCMGQLAQSLKGAIPSFAAPTAQALAYDADWACTLRPSACAMRADCR